MWGRRAKKAGDDVNTRNPPNPPIPATLLLNPQHPPPPLSLPLPLPLPLPLTLFSLTASSPSFQSIPSVSSKKNSRITQ